MTMKMFDESDRELMRRTMTYQRTILGLNLKALCFALLSFISIFKQALAEVEAERSEVEKYPERLLGWK